MRSRFPLSLLLAAAALGPAHAQRLVDGSNALDKKDKQHFSLQKQIFKGEIKTDPKSADHVEAVEVQAKLLVYPLNWKTVSGRPKAGDINTLVETFDTNLNNLSSPRNRGNTAETQQLFCKVAIGAAAEVMKDKSSRPIASMNAARLLARIPDRKTLRDVPIPEKEWLDEILPRLAAGNAELLAVSCVERLEDPNTADATRYWLFRTLSALMAIPPQNPPLVKKETVEKVYAAAVKAVEKQVPFPRDTPRQEVEGYKILRLQPITLLAQARVPVVGKEKVALTLARVAGGDVSIVPPPRHEERVEAAIGLARMGPSVAKSPDFHADYAMYVIAQAAASFGSQANANREKRPQERLAPWAVEAARLLEAVEGFRHDVKLPYVQQAGEQSVKLVLEFVERRDPANHAGLSDWLRQNPPASKTLFKGDASSAIKSGSEATKEEKPKDDDEKES